MTHLHKSSVLHCSHIPCIDTASTESHMSMTHAAVLCWSLFISIFVIMSVCLPVKFPSSPILYSSYIVDFIIFFLFSLAHCLLLTLYLSIKKTPPLNKANTNSRLKLVFPHEEIDRKRLCWKCSVCDFAMNECVDFRCGVKSFVLH